MPILRPHPILLRSETLGEKPEKQDLLTGSFLESAKFGKHCYRAITEAMI